jgi:hypothetical protein
MLKIDLSQTFPEDRRRTNNSVSILMNCA